MHGNSNTNRSCIAGTMHCTHQLDTLIIVLFKSYPDFRDHTVHVTCHLVHYVLYMFCIVLYIAYGKKMIKKS